MDGWRTAHEVLDRARHGVRLGLVEPPLHAPEALAAGDVVHEDHAVRAAVVAVGESAESFCRCVEPREVSLA